ncbi:hypothetical protein [Leptolyngbya sp. NIES-2104]|uniref:hypothetical protein n=1 Tax=Leptolyngbya sp. NIES-2104 TaxID=1552121 RepID=UPI0006EC5B13|nr:hypothetical protein [Leptolyngbya sp. NIES-2104]GAP96103.1 hypothetical protein NIES2104_26380 [Leptolyngbya sp. NIES-2104]
MTKGFQSTDETKIAIVIKRLAPAAKREDYDALNQGILKMVERHGGEVVEQAMIRMIDDFPFVRQKAIENLPDDQKQMFNAEAVAIIAGLLEESGLRLEDHIRYGDRGIALTHEAIRAIANTGCPNASDFGIGNESLEGIGIDRAPFMHPLTETFQHNGEDYVNSWGLASMTINSVLNWLDEPPDNPETPRSFIADCVSRVAPTVDLEAMLFRARYDDRALMKLASYVESGFNAIAQKAVDDRK